LRSSSLLFQAFDSAGVDDRVYNLVEAIRTWAGLGRTVWGMKQQGEDIFWEFYFYDYRRRERQRSITGFLEAIRPFATCPFKANERSDYFMFSVDIDHDLIAGRKNLNEIHVYLGNPGSTVSSGICYSLTSGPTRLENFYFFFDARKQIGEIMDKVACSSHYDAAALGLDQVIWPELRNCNVIVIANKQFNDGIYFSRVNIDQLIFFMKRMAWPEKLISFVEENRFKLDHLLFDVAFDYRMEGNTLMILKSACFGIF